ncbi:HAD hydrolase family protein [Arthrobacter alpinus]|nr:HAD hydrolase family protein [Arthrobacter alpinus]
MNANILATAHTTRAIFLDVDGTYADFGVVPEAHVEAVRAVRAAGHKVLICTGRPLPMLPESIMGAGFDGVVASAGAYIEVAGEVLVDKRFPADLRSRALAALDAHDTVYVLESQEATFVTPAGEDRLRAHIAAHYASAPADRAIGSSAILAGLTVRADLSTTTFAKISVFESPSPWRSSWRKSVVTLTSSQIPLPPKARMPGNSSSAASARQTALLPSLPTSTSPSRPPLRLVTVKTIWKWWPSRALVWPSRDPRPSY